MLWRTMRQYSKIGFTYDSKIIRIHPNTVNVRENKPIRPPSFAAQVEHAVRESGCTGLEPWERQGWPADLFLRLCSGVAFILGYPASIS